MRTNPVQLGLHVDLIVVGSALGAVAAVGPLVA